MMKKFYLALLCVLSMEVASAQCDAYIDIQANGNEVTVTINGTGAGSPLYTIDWGDNNSDFSQTATHTYADPGTYLITWVYADLSPLGCPPITASQEVIITGGGCTLDFSPIAFGLLVTLDASSSNTSNPNYTIDWGDNSLPENGNQAIHQYATAGSYTICVTMVDADNPDFCTLTQCATVDLVESSGNCTVDLTLTTDGFNVASTATGFGAVTEMYLITWGDGTYSNSSSDVHTYANSGDYQICAYYVDMMPGGCTVSICQSVTIESVADCTLDITATPVGLNVALTATGSGAAVPAYSIDWGDNSGIDTAVPAFHNYTAEGTYLICVTYLDESNLIGCQVNQCQEVTLTAASTDCTAQIDVTVNGSTATATSSGTGAVNPTYAIDWGDNSFPSLGASGSHTYTASGSYDVCVTYLDLNNVQGCVVTECQTIDVTVGVNESVFPDHAIGVMPNPLAENCVITISLNHASNIQVDVFDLVGNKVENVLNQTRGQGLHRIAWDTSSLSSGIYFVKVLADNEAKTVKVIK